VQQLDFSNADRPVTGEDYELAIIGLRTTAHNASAAVLASTQQQALLDSDRRRFCIDS